MYGFLADAVLLVHFGFVVFVVLGGLMVQKWRWVAWLHLPAAAWGVALEVGGWTCPLTPLENHLRERAGQSTYGQDFIARYLLPVLYPEGLTREAQLVLGIAAILVNVAIYRLALRRRVVQQ